MFYFYLVVVDLLAYKHAKGDEIIYKYWILKGPKQDMGFDFWESESTNRRNLTIS